MGRDLDGFSDDALVEELGRRRANLAVAHPRELHMRQVADVDQRESIDLVATGTDGITLTIRATRAHWGIIVGGGPVPSLAEHARDLYLRGIIDADEFARRLDEATG